MLKDDITEAPLRSKMLSEQAVALETDLRKSTSTTESAIIARRMIRKLQELAPQYGYAARTADETDTLVRIDRLYEDLERIEVDPQRSLQDLRDHADFLADFGFGHVIRGAHYRRDSQPDYGRAIQLYSRIRDTTTGMRSQDAGEAIEKICAPRLVLAVGNADREMTGLIRVLVRNLDSVTISLSDRKTGAQVIPEWKATFSGSEDHRVRRRDFLVSNVGLLEGVLVSATAPGEETATATFTDLSALTDAAWVLKQVADTKSSRIKGVRLLSSSDGETYWSSVAADHVMGQGCALCHILPFGVDPQRFHQAIRR